MIIKKEGRLVIIGRILKKYFKYVKGIQERRKKEEQYYAKMKEEALKTKLENDRLKKILDDMEEMKKIFSFKVPNDVLIDIAELEHAEKRDYNYLKNGLKNAIAQRRISHNDAISIKGYVYDKYKEEKIW